MLKKITSFALMSPPQATGDAQSVNARKRAFFHFLKKILHSSLLILNFLLPLQFLITFVSEQ